MLYFVSDIGLEILRGEANFPADSITSGSDALLKTDDVFPDAQVKPKCVLATMARQVRRGDSHFLTIDTRLFSHPLHSKLSQAVLLLHEYLYSIAIEKGQTDSYGTRVIVGMAISSPGSVTLRSFEDKAAEAGFLEPYLHDPWVYPHYSYAMCRLDRFFEQLFDSATRRVVQARKSPAIGALLDEIHAFDQDPGIQCCKSLPDCGFRLSHNYCTDPAMSAKAAELTKKISAMQDSFAAQKSLESLYKRYMAPSLAGYLPGISPQAAQVTERKILELLHALSGEMEYAALSSEEYDFGDGESQGKKWNPASSLSPYTYAVYGWTDYGILSTDAVPSLPQPDSDGYLPAMPQACW